MQIRRRKRKKLSSKIFFSVTLLIITGIFQLLFESSILRYFQSQRKHLENNIAEAYLTERNSTFSYVNSALQSMLYDGSEVQRVSDAFKSNEVNEALTIFEQVNSVSTLKDKFRRMVNTYGNDLNFFYYDPASKKLVEYGYSDIDIREEFLDGILKDIENKQLTNTRNKKWYLYDNNYICTVNRGMKGYAGCYMLASSFTEKIINMSAEGGIRVALYDKKKQNSFIQERKKDTSITTYITNEKQNDSDFRKLPSADFQVNIQLNSQNITMPLVFQFLFTLSLVFYLLLVVWTLHDLKKNILGQANYFYKNLLQYSNQLHFHEENGIVEFAEAAKVLNQLAEEINRLKIDIYEQQLEKKKVELDYAQLQIRPHFYINCLNVIYSMSQTGRVSEIQNLTLQVSKYLRYIFKKSVAPVPLKEELDFLANFLKVQESISGSKFRAVITLEEGLDYFPIPPLIIQTFVENSLKHGLDIEKPFLVTVDAAKVEQEETSYVKILVRDSGKGMDAELCRNYNLGNFTVDDETHQIGIRNAIKRMEMLYGEKAYIHFGNDPEGGAETIMFFPMMEVEVTNN